MSAYAEAPENTGGTAFAGAPESSEKGSSKREGAGFENAGSFACYNGSEKTGSSA